jgi:hypothetical protein
LSADEARALERLRTLARIWDEWFRVPLLGWRVGLDPLIGLVPGLGDLVGGIVGSYALFLAVEAGAGVPILGRMAMNVAIDALLGAVPVLGDLFDFGWKANSRNWALLERFLADPVRTKRASAIGLALGGATVGGFAAASVWLSLTGIRWLLR